MSIWGKHGLESDGDDGLASGHGSYKTVSSAARVGSADVTRGLATATAVDAREFVAAKVAICRRSCNPSCSGRSKSSRSSASAAAAGRQRWTVRVIAATHQDLAEMVQQRTIRADLYYRLNVFPIQVPPLRARAEDIPLVVHHFVRRFAERQGSS